MAERVGFSPEMRLACQLRPDADLIVRRLVLDETDLAMCSQLDRAVATRAGKEKFVAILFSDVVDSTSMSEKLSPYDLLYLLNRYFVQVGDIIEKNGGFIDRFVGDGVINTNTGLPRPLCSDFTEDRGLICRWHHSCFDLQTGEIRDWAPVLNEDGTTTGWEFLGDVSRHRTQLEVYPCRISEGFVWLALAKARQARDDALGTSIPSNGTPG